jgi:hypothetical protein
MQGTDGNGMPLWRKLMIYSSQTALHGGQPIHPGDSRCGMSL